MMADSRGAPALLSATRKRIGRLEAKLSSLDPDTQIPLAGV